MQQPKKGSEWHFGMKAHIGVDAEGGLGHFSVATPDHVVYIAKTAELLHGKELFATGYIGDELSREKSALNALKQGLWGRRIKKR